MNLVDSAGHSDHDKLMQSGHISAHLTLEISEPPTTMALAATATATAAVKTITTARTTLIMGETFRFRLLKVLVWHHVAIEAMRRERLRVYLCVVN